MKPLYTICWRDLDTITSGYGTQPLTAAQAEAWIAQLKKEYPHMEHFMMPIGPNGEIWKGVTP